MRKKGFTLIELLAVIVILAIIALIATPIVMNTIENAKKGAAERSAENYLSAVETEVAKQRIDNVVLEGEYTIQEDGNLCPAGETCTDETEIQIDMSGNKPSSGTIIIENGKVVDELSTDTSKKTTMTVDDYTVSYDSNTKQLVAEKQESGSAVANVCTYKGTDSSKKYAYGAEYECDPGDGVTRTFYMLEDGSDNVSLIMDRNIVAFVSWLGPDLGKESGNKPENALAALKAQTTDKGWTVDVSMPTNAQINATKNSDNNLPEFLVVNIGVGSLPEEHDGYWTTGHSVGECYVYCDECDFVCDIKADYVKPIYVDGVGFSEFGEIATRTSWEEVPGVRPVITVPKTQVG